MSKSPIEKFDPISEESRKERKVFDAISREEQKRTLDELHERALLENSQTFAKKAEVETDQIHKEELELTKKLAEKVQKAGGLVLVVGGYARDEAFRRFGYDLKPKDIDIEVYGLEFEKLKEILGTLGEIDIVGAAFGVIKLKTSFKTQLDVSIPRRDSKTGRGHKGFIVEGDPTMMIKEAASRRDFTINALALNPLTGEIIDKFGGLEDMQNKVLRATDFEKFAEDPLRVLRGAQFAGRFGFTIDKRTVELSRSIDLHELPKERIGGEWEKMLLKSPKPSAGLEAARELGVIEQLHPELHALVGIPQDPKWHPEGDVWVHTKLVTDEAVVILKREGIYGQSDSKERVLAVILGALCHDFGKPGTTETSDDGRIISHGHEEAGLEPTKKFLRGIYVPDQIIQKVLVLVKFHLRPAKPAEIATTEAIKRLAKKLGGAGASIEDLVWVSEADQRGRNIPMENFTAGADLLKRAKELGIAKEHTKPILLGRHLQELGIQPGLRYGKILREIEELQLEGKVKDQDQAKRIAKLLNFFIDVESKDIKPVQLLNGELMTKEEMVEFLKERFLDEGTHDMGTLVMTLLLQEKKLPEVLEKNKVAILTAHKLGPVWFKHFTQEFYDTSWKSFYGEFEVNLDEQKRLKEVFFDDQIKEALQLIQIPDQKNIEEYNETFNVKPVRHEGEFALYVTDQYPFEAGLMDGYKIMVKFGPERKSLSISILDEDPVKVKVIDQKIREILPEFANARKTGYLFAERNGEDNVFSEDDGSRVLKVLLEHREILI